jgi:hypothetical protein
LLGLDAHGAQPFLYVHGYPVCNFHHGLVERKVFLVFLLAIDPNVVVLRVNPDAAFVQHDLLEHLCQFRITLQDISKAVHASPLDLDNALVAKVAPCFRLALGKKVAVLLAFNLDDVVDLLVVQSAIRQWSWIYFWHAL